MHDVLHRIGEALLLALGMGWQVAWSLVLGFTLSGLLQVLVSHESMVRLLGRDRPREIALATGFGAASSSCSYAAVSVARTLLERGAALIPALAFMFASTNLVIELGIVLLLLLGWQFTLGEWIGGVVLIAILSVLVRLTCPPGLAEEARRHAREAHAGHEHGSEAAAGSVWERLGQRETWIAVAQSFAMDWQMLWKDLVAGFLIAGVLAAFVPTAFWHGLFLRGGPAWLRVPVDALLGPLVAMLTFVCSIGNVPMAAILWGGGVGFGGVLAFLYADLIVLPLLDAYRRTFGLRMAAYMGAVFYATMVLAALVMDLAFRALGLVPHAAGDVRHQMVHFSLNYTFWLNLGFGALALWLAWLARRNPMAHHHACEHHGHHHDHAHHHAHHAHHDVV